MRHRSCGWGAFASILVLSGPIVAAGDAGAAQAAPKAAVAPNEKAVVVRPGFADPRYGEDWSVLRDAAGEARTTGLDRLKYIPIHEESGIWASLGGQARIRHESWNDFGFGGAGDRDDSILLTRVRYHADLHVTEYLRGFVEGISAFSTLRDLPPGARRGADVDELDLQNAFLDLSLPVGDLGRATFRAGRQELLFGKERLISPLDWGNTRRTFEGFTGIFDTGKGKLTGFYTQLVSSQKYDFDKADAGTELFGLYGTSRPFGLGVDLDLYFIGLRRDAAAVGGGFNGTAGREDRFTLGGRTIGPISDTPLDYEIEGAYQLGEVGRGDIDAFMVATQLGFRPPLECLKRHGLRLYGGFDYASGDDSAGGDVGTFNQLFPLGHAFHGFIDAVGRQNVADFTTGLSLKPTPKLTAKVDLHYFVRAERADALYNAGGGVLRAGGAGRSRDVGPELDLLFKYVFDARLVGLAGYSHFFPGNFIEESGAASGIDFIYLSFQYTF